MEMPPFSAFAFPFLLFPLLLSSTPPSPSTPLQPSIPLSNFSMENAAEISALSDFRRALQDPLGALSGWDPYGAGAPCSWRGVICSPSEPRVTELRLPRLRLAGNISSSLSTLSHLIRLSLRSNILSGPIPPTLFQLPRLRFLFLQHNALTGPYPGSNISVLEVFSAADNLLSGPLPTTLPPKLSFLDLSSNSFSGFIPSNFTSSAPRLRFLDLSFNRLGGTVPPALGSLRFLLYLHLDGNLLEGTIPALLANCSSLLYLSLGGNNLRGILPLAVAGIPTLQILALSNNHLSGSIPSSILFNYSSASPPHLRILQLGQNAFTELSFPSQWTARLAASSSVLQVLDLKENGLAGSFPSWLSNITTLVVLDLSGNSFSGTMPPNIGRLSVVRELRIGGNLLNGHVPAEIGQCVSLRVLDLEQNRFTGEAPAIVGTLDRLTDLYLGGNLFTGRIPRSLGNLSNLEYLSLYKNILIGDFPEEFTKLNKLIFLDLSGNVLTGEIPATIGILQRIENLNLSDNAFSGNIPVMIGNLSNLRILDLSRQKNLSGEIPDELFGLPNIEVISMAENLLTGLVPEGFSSLWSLKKLNLSSNSFSGSIPATYGYLPSLQVLALSDNHISGMIPFELGNCSNLTILRIRSNKLHGSVPGDISKLSLLMELDLGINYLSGRFPPEISRCSSLVILRLDRNGLSGLLPNSISNLSELQVLDLSTNMFSGSIPSSLSRLSSMIYLNLSSNDLEGEIPSMLSARFHDPSLFEGNPDLCGQPLKTECANDRRKRRRRRIEKLVLLVGLVSAAAAFLALFCFFCVFSLLRYRRRILDRRNGIKKRSSGRGSGSSSGAENGGPKLVMFNNKITYAETLEAIRNFDEENVLSRGRHGLVFKASYNDGAVLSILRLPPVQSDGSGVVEEAAFRKEAESLGKVKHRNLTVLRGYYAGPPPDVRLLVYDYMPNGSLATLLQEASHQDGHVLNWPMRHLIALGIARGLAHLHSSGIIHGDVKPQNVLFDADFEPHLSDFGLDRLAAPGPEVFAGASTSVAVVGSVGYAAPDAVAAGQGTREGDVYSFGIVVLELLTGKGPAMFAGEEEDIVKWVKRQLQLGAVAELLEPGLLELDPESSEWEEFLLGVKVGLLCTAPQPTDRPSMSDVVFMLEGCRVAPEIPSSAGPTTSQPSPT